MCRYCSRPAQKRGLCSTHERRQRMGQQMDAPLKPFRMASYERLCVPVNYDSAHYRCKRLWGGASNYPCVGCGGSAREWSYDGTDPTELVGGSQGRDHRDGVEMRYSLWPEFYAPMCRKCHAAFDHPGEVTVNENW